MKIGKKFNLLSKQEYYYVIDNYKKYSDFNTLGLYRSILESEKLDLEEKLEVRDYVNQTFGKTFIFLQLKDPKTYFDLQTLGETLTVADEYQLWEDIRHNQQKILADRKIKHRNFGTYSKHNCGYDTCRYNGLMVKQGSFLKESHIHFDGDKNKYQAKIKSERRKSHRKQVDRIIDQELENK